MTALPAEEGRRTTKSSRPSRPAVAATSATATSESHATLARESDKGNIAQPRAKRVQVARACQRCRRLQKACSDSRPCQRCTRAGLSDECSGFAVQSRALSQNPSSQLFKSADAPVRIYGAANSFDTAPRPLFINLELPSSPQSFTSFSRESFEKKADLLPPQVIDYCSGRFFERLAPTIPILTPEYVANLRTRAPSESEAYCVLLGLCTMVTLQVEDPRDKYFGPFVTAENNAAYGWLLLEEALAAHRHLARRSNPCLDSVLLVFFIYACHASLFHHSQAFFFLREAATLFILVKPDTMDSLSRSLCERLFWVLLVSERSHAIRYRRPITLQVTTNGFGLSLSSDEDRSLCGFRCLAALFRGLDTSFIALLNQETVSRTLAHDSLDDVEISINTALNHSCPSDLLPTQKANLRVTQLWLRIVLWQLRLRLGHLSEQSTQSSRTYHYPLDVAKDLTLSTRDLPIHSIQVHGAGITEKLFDISCAVVNVLARVPVRVTKAAAEDDLKYVRRLILQLPGGATVYDALLLKHIQQTLPTMAAALEV
ncbi:uncharacterized protein F4807DRAFT_242586 [Annulohypoxylon truncatum]|uniref:uncharacterized protein n=1 Tax=Annulohypoxylon truncatum TaxID=327061 RepID=UPI002008A2B8|nr:uncharacterized protein F4807DRAFT_242586 [Annulohypoxylon truncatum]KAI1206019.1 hypothetical protein F4807DRAFT_242586 [Annulohypoxylon truncatum]